MKVEPYYTSACLLVTKDGYQLYLTEKEDLGSIYADDIREIRRRGLLKDEIRKEIKSWKRIAVNYSSFLLSHSRLLGRKRKVDISKDLLKLRSRKDSLELKLMKRVCKYTDHVARKLLSSFTQFQRESDVATFIFDLASRSDAQLAFPPIVATNKRSSQVHPIPSYTTSFLGKITLIDFGFRMNGYCSDLTLTVFHQKPGKNELSLAESLECLIPEIEEKIEEGSWGRELFLVFKRFLSTFNRKPQHALGHGIGLEVHELPSLSELSRDRIKSGNTFTLEPGVYLKNFGLRIENCYLLKGRKLLKLTKTGGIFVL